MNAPPYYQDDLVTLYHGDCLEVLPALADRFDMVFTSPPYNLGRMSGGKANLDGGYRTYADSMPPEAYAAWQAHVLRECWASLTDTGAIFYNHKPIIRDGIAHLPTELNPGLPLRQIVIWYRQWGVNWAPTHFLPVHEWILILAKEDWRLRGRSASKVSDVWTVRPDMGDDEHPATFPLSLPALAFEATETRTVLDPFAGSGTTLRAAKSRGIRSVGIEIDERYCEITAKRLAQEAFDFGDWEDAS